MSREQMVYAVILDRSVEAELGILLEPYLENMVDKYKGVDCLVCKRVDPEGNYLSAIIDRKKPDGSTVETKLHLPHRFVRLVVSAGDRKDIALLSG